MALSAITGCAATQIDGTTIDWLLSLMSLFPNSKTNKNNRNKALLSLPPQINSMIQQRLDGAKVLVIDEISMASMEKLGKIDTVLRLVKAVDQPFGGMHIILSGDMYQLPPVAAHPIYSDAVNFEGNMKADSTYREKGVHLFKQFTKIELEGQQRCKDPIHTELIEKIRSQKCLKDCDIAGLPELSPQDCFKKQWRYSTLVVTGNLQRDAINKIQTKRWAVEHNEPIFTWCNKVGGHAGDNEDDNYRSKMLAETCMPWLKRVFVRGAPCMIRRNVNPLKKVANGIMGTFHSLTWDSGYSLPTTWLPGEEFDIPCPSSVNLLIKNKNGEERVIPIRYDRRPEWQKVPTTGGKRPVRGIPVDTAFAITFHKIQGATMDNIILCLNKQHGYGNHHTFPMVYVGLTRVKYQKDLRILPIANTKDRYDHLTRLAPYATLAMWENCYDKNGKWVFGEVETYLKTMASLI